MRDGYLVVSGLVFGLVTAAHVVRAIGMFPVEIFVGGVSIPLWASWVAAAVSGALCFWAFREREIFPKRP